MKEIKTKSDAKYIKVLDKASDVSRKMKNAYIRTKGQAEQLGHNENGNYVDDAGNSVREGTETVARKAGHALENQGKNAMQKIKERRAPDTDALRSDSLNGDYARQAPESEAKETIRRNLARTGTQQVNEQSAASSQAEEAVKQHVSKPGAKQAAKQNAAQSKAKETVKREIILSKPNELAKRRFVPLFQPAKKTAAQTANTSGEAGRTIKQSAGAGGKTVKKTAKGAVKTVQKSVKTAEHSAKAGIKTS